MKALALVFLWALAATAQDKAAPSTGSGQAPACDMATIESAPWCPKCAKLLRDDQIAEEKCKECKSVPEKVAVCVKSWIPRCGMHEQTPHRECCCKSKFCCKPEILKKRILFSCEGCGQTAASEGAVAHATKEHEKKIVKKCEGSGTRPHGGEPIP